MGDRVSIAFKYDKETSVVLFSHWGGMDFVKRAKQYLKELKEYIKTKDKRICQPLDRLEPQTVMIDFIRWETKDMDRVESDLYLGATENDGDNSDNGHHNIKLNT